MCQTWGVQISGNVSELKFEDPKNSSVDLGKRCLKKKTHEQFIPTIGVHAPEKLGNGGGRGDQRAIQV